MLENSNNNNNNNNNKTIISEGDITNGTCECQGNQIIQKHLEHIHGKLQLNPIAFPVTAQNLRKVLTWHLFNFEYFPSVRTPKTMLLLLRPMIIMIKITTMMIMMTKVIAINKWKLK